MHAEGQAEAEVRKGLKFTVPVPAFSIASPVPGPMPLGPLELPHQFDTASMLVALSVYKPAPLGPGVLPAMLL